MVAALDASTTARAMALQEAPPAVGKYDALKAFLMKLFELSELEKADRLLSLNGLGDSKPSELMKRMLAVWGSADPAFLFTHIFLRQLPAACAHCASLLPLRPLQGLLRAGCRSRQDFPCQPAAVCARTAPYPWRFDPIAPFGGHLRHRSRGDGPPPAQRQVVLLPCQVWSQG